MKNIFKYFLSCQYNNDMVKLYTTALRRVSFAFLLVYCLIVISLYAYVPLSILSTWLMTALFHVFLTHFIGKILSLGLSKNRNNNKYICISALICAYGGIIWGSLAGISYLYLPASYHFIIVVMMMGLSAILIPAFITVLVSYLSFVLPLVFLFLSMLVYIGGSENIVLAIMLLIYMIGIVSTAKLFHEKIKESLILKKDLTISKEKLASLSQVFNQRLEEKSKALEYNLYYDNLTGLANIKKLYEEVSIDDDAYIILLDIKEFSILNKQYGKIIGDKTLVEISVLLTRQLCGGVTLYRGDDGHFIMYCKGMTLETLKEYVEQVITFFEVYLIEVVQREFFITLRAGITYARSAEDFIIQAEYALVMAKRKKIKYLIYDLKEEELQNEKEIIDWLSRTKELVLSENIKPLFQPIYDIKKGKILKYECLARGMIENTLIEPYKFLKAAERLDLIKNITHIVIDKSFEFFQDNDYFFSINITGSDLLDHNFCEFLDLKLKRYQMDPSRVTFEILENITIFSNANIFIESLNQIKKRGCKIAIDDFGIENSNFSRLVLIDFDFIKIDGSFIKNIINNEKDKKIVHSMVGLAKTLGVQTVAEFVENAEVLKVIKELGVDYAQGYHIGKPEEYLLD